MKELDQLLTRYLDNDYRTAPDDEKAGFRALLKLPDPELAGYFLGRQVPDDEMIAIAVRRILRID